ncbi:MAG: SDR family NAD(P)-dependent oxidoreductase [Actinobacteria bacterium]|nr:SDR family NAD(P)-dependent oxidoreductase [Actinomycetota bacterium]
MAAWSDTHALVTGGSSGLGLATAVLAAERGAHVTLVARDEARLATARERVLAARASESQRVITRSADVGDREDLMGAIASASAETGPVEWLFACAGYCTPGRFVELPLEAFEEHARVNLLGVVHAARAVAPAMVERGHGHIAMVSSMGGLVGVYGYSAYSAAKFGVTGFAEVLRCEMKPHGVGVTLLTPSNIDTPGYAREIATEPAETKAINGIAKTRSPEETAKLFVRGVERGHFLVLPGFSNRLLYRLEGLWPEAFFALFDSTVAEARKGASAHAE